MKQQGDVLIRRSAIPRGAKKLCHLVLAEGESTGHRHEVFGLAQLLSYDEQLYLEVMGPSEVRHAEHSTIVLEPEAYSVGFVREYDHFEEEARRVLD